MSFFSESTTSIAGINSSVSDAKSSNAIYFKSNLDRGAYIQDVYVRNVQADTVRTALIRFEPNYKGERSAFHPTLFDSFLIENVTCKQSNECGIYMAGFAERPLQNIVLKNVTIGKVPTPYCFQNGENIRFQSVKVNGKKLDEKPTPKELVKLRVL